MGIDVRRFVGNIHEPFLCYVCLDVVDDPVVTPCDHIFCKSCFKGNDCPTCRTPVITVKAMNRILEQVYGLLPMTCLARNCLTRITISNYGSHDYSCPRLTYHCRTCECNNISAKDCLNHDCIKYLKEKMAEMQIKLEQKESRRGEFHF